MLVYNANLRQIGAGDTLSARYLPLMLWHTGALDPGADAALFAQGHPVDKRPNRPANDNDKVKYFEPSAYWLIRTRGHELASLYPVVTPLLVAPLYTPAVLWLNAKEWKQPHIDWVALWMEKLAASLLAAAAAVIVFVMLRREGNAWRLPLALAFAFGTNTWMISSQALWQHGTGELLIGLALLLVLAPASAIRLALLGAVCVLMAANRPPDALVALAIGCFVIWRNWRSTRWLIVGAVVPMALLLYYNLGYMGHIAGGYGLVKPPPDFHQGMGSGVAGLLVSPSRGLLVFSPFLAFVVVGLIQRLRSPATRALAVALSLAVIAQILGYAVGDWRAGNSWGPRWLTDILPILIWILAPAPLVMRPAARVVFLAAIVFSIGVQFVGAFWYTGSSDRLIYADGTASMRGAWDIRNTPFVSELRHPPAPTNLACAANGAIDRIGSTTPPYPETLPVLEPGSVIKGWALTCARSPAQVALLINGVIIGRTNKFKSQANVDLANRVRSNWQVTASLWGVASGDQLLQLAVSVDPGSSFRIVHEQHVMVRPQPPSKAFAETPQPQSAVDLDAMAAHASSLLRKHQTDYGAWLTAHTKDSIYEAPRPELNTFLTSVLVDLVSPIARSHDLDDALERARAHLAAQIESNGLVRYHGLPDGPMIGKLGCAITPDADDTALVWRIAGPGVGDPKLRPMLDLLASYRDARGLYRTWLAAQKSYRCLDPGRDPNPTDIAIQLHVYMMLRELDPRSAQAFCGTLQRAYRDEDIWVYYAHSALLPYLRIAELSQLGCSLPLPIERLALPVEGQEIWAEAAYWLVAASGSPEKVEAHQEVLRVLSQLGADDFALLRRSPPLLYHNDFTATVSRYYWSEDFGYALWLRLYEAARLEPEPQQQDPQ